MRARMAAYVASLQDSIVSALESLDPNAPKLKGDEWERPEGGYGISCAFAVLTLRLLAWLVFPLLHLVGCISPQWDTFLHCIETHFEQGMKRVS